MTASAIPPFDRLTDAAPHGRLLSNGRYRVLLTSAGTGYSAWGEGQLESEISDNSWLTVPADVAVIFDTPVEQRYDKALMLLGLQSWMLSPDAGHA